MEFGVATSDQPLKSIAHSDEHFDRQLFELRVFLCWKVIAPGRVHILTASPHLDTPTAAIEKSTRLPE
jgi:hypothetical protein